MNGVLPERVPLERFKTRLAESRRKLLTSARRTLRVDDARFDSDDLPDEVDAATQEQSQSLILRLRDREKFFLAKIDAALERIARGTFATCDRCGQEIPLERLEARPVTTLCVDCKEEEEQEMKRSFGSSRQSA